MREVFVDTGCFLALAIAEDPAHARAHELFAQADGECWRLLTTNAVVYETCGVLLVRSRNMRHTSMTFLDLMDEGRILTERVTVADDARARMILRGHRDKTYSYCDALSFSVMERLGISEALSFDRHFREYGRFTIL